MTLFVASNFVSRTTPVSLLNKNSILTSFLWNCRWKRIDHHTFRAMGDKEGKPTLRHVRHKEQLNGRPAPVPGIINLNVIGSGGKGTARSVTLNTESNGYV